MRPIALTRHGNTLNELLSQRGEPVELLEFMNEYSSGSTVLVVNVPEAFKDQYRSTFARFFAFGKVLIEHTNQPEFFLTEAEITALLESDYAVRELPAHQLNAFVIADDRSTSDQILLTHIDEDTVIIMPFSLVPDRINPLGQSVNLSH